MLEWALYLVGALLIAGVVWAADQFFTALVDWLDGLL